MLARGGDTRRAVAAVLVAGIPVVLGGCVYYNTFFNARRAYEDAEKSRIEQGRRQQAAETVASSSQAPSSETSRSSSSVRARASAVGAEALYRTAIEKSAKVLAYYRTSDYVDDALLLMAKAYFHLQEYTASLRKCDELLASFPRSALVPEARYWRGMTLWKVGNSEDAALVLKSIADDPASPYRGDAAYALAAIRHHDGALDEAIRYYRAAVAKARDPLIGAQARKDLGECLLQADRPEEAARYYRELAAELQLAKDKYSAYMKMAAAQRQMGDYDGALRTLQPLLSDERYDEFIPRTRIELGLIHEEEGEVEAAMLLYQKVLDEAERQSPAQAQPRPAGTTTPQADQSRPTTPQTPETAEANYRLGLLRETRYHNYASATEHYSLAEQNQSLDVGKAAHQRKEALARWAELHAALADTSDSTKTRARDATLYELAQHFLLNIEDADSALAYFQAVADSFPEGSLAPKARYAIGWVWLSVRHDTARADSAWRPFLADTAAAGQLRLYRQDARRLLGIERPDPAFSLYLEAETAWLDALKEAPPHLPDSLAADSLGAARWWEAWRARHGPLSERYVPTFKRIVEEYSESPYATRSRFVLGWTADNVAQDSAAAAEWYRRASGDTLILSDIAARARAVMDLRTAAPSAAAAAADTTRRAPPAKQPITPDSLGREPSHGIAPPDSGRAGPEVAPPPAAFVPPEKAQ